MSATLFRLVPPFGGLLRIHEASMQWWRHLLRTDRFGPASAGPDLPCCLAGPVRCTGDAAGSIGGRRIKPDS